MRVGVILRDEILINCEPGIPHASGGDPLLLNSLAIAHSVFPMRVGVIPLPCGCDERPAGIPHASGGDPHSGSK